MLVHVTSNTKIFQREKKLITYFSLGSGIIICFSPWFLFKVPPPWATLGTWAKAEHRRTVIAGKNYDSLKAEFKVLKQSWKKVQQLLKVSEWIKPDSWIPTILLSLKVHTPTKELPRPYIVSKLLPYSLKYVALKKKKRYTYRTLLYPNKKYFKHVLLVEIGKTTWIGFILSFIFYF